MSTGEQTSASRPLRADAARNRARIIAAASELFAERGLDVTLDDVAARAGVGVGTVYRRFANRDELIVGVFTDHLDNVGARIRIAAADTDPWESVVVLITTIGELLASDRGLATILMAVDHSDPTLVAGKKVVETLVTEILERAKDAHAIRAEIEPTDMFGIVCMLAAIGDATQGVDGAWRRFAEIILAGLRADGRPVPLTTPALTDAQLQHIDECKLDHRR
ncbi:TetR/AcrR family transcriptional regulator [Gordonia sp. HY285]|uniref:TetR/AcrR family transcriptional regulator n=1 Tax=Gordonia liuliyuniae TaxID=2911517 RepID=UPI001F41533C|nr:TetR/AcrR family transcriptional regulator [Gordonia liuliyuniae]MCF8612119.1 TetR/AcrR family transcriptional regulator [Gordonia liuliyuniae]